MPWEGDLGRKEFGVSGAGCCHSCWSSRSPEPQLDLLFNVLVIRGRTNPHPKLPLPLPPPCFLSFPLSHPVIFLFHLFLHSGSIFSTFLEEPGTPRAEGTELSNSARFCHLLPTPTPSQSPARLRKPPRLSPPSPSEKTAPGQEKTAAVLHSSVRQGGGAGVREAGLFLREWRDPRCWGEGNCLLPFLKAWSPWERGRVGIPSQPGEGCKLLVTGRLALAG